MRMNFATKSKIALTAVLAVSGVVIASSGSFSTPVDHTINIQGTVTDTCSVPSTVTNHIANFNTLTNGQDGTVVPDEIMIPIGNMSCNYGIQLALQTQKGALATDASGPIPSNFTNKVEYNATVDWGGATFRLEARGNPTTANATLGPRDDSIVLSIETLENPDKKLISGAYSDVLTLRIGGTL